MDGLAAARAIRRLPGKASLPIIAMTANAFEEDRKRCLESGMNDHIGKPVDPDALSKALLRWLPLLPNPAAAQAVPLPSEDALRKELIEIAGLDVETGVASVRGRFPSYLRMLNLFFTTHTDDVALLRQHFESGQADELRRFVHTLKGVAAMLGAEMLRRRSLELEQAIRQGEPEDVAVRVDAVETEINALFAALRQILMDRRVIAEQTPEL
jgi:CheY-like chemotaxis protein